MLPGVKVGTYYRGKGSGGGWCAPQGTERNQHTVFEQRLSQRAVPIFTEVILANLFVLGRAWAKERK